MIKTPLNQQRQTNIAIVRMKIKNKKFEIAAYKNKVVSWRAGTEKDLSEVLQKVKVFTNVSKGDLARKEDLIKYFNEEDEEKVCVTILNKGELQLGEKEREIMYESLYRDIVTIVCNLCINPDTQRPYPPGIIDRALKEIHFSVKPGKSAKKQALEVIRKLKKNIAIERAQMRLEIFISQSALSRKMKTLLKNGDAHIEKDTFNPDDKSVSLIVLIDPGMFRTIDEFANEHGDDCRVNVLDTTVLREGEEKIDDILSDDEDQNNEEADEGTTISASKNVSSDDEQLESSKTSSSSSSKQKKKKGSGKQKGGKKGKHAADSDEELEQTRKTNSKKKSKKGRRANDDSSDEDETAQQQAATVDDEEEEEFATMKKKAGNNRRKKKSPEM